jgi:hypothetical protein
MSVRKFRRPSWLEYCLLAVILFGVFVLFSGGDDNSATMAPNLVLTR